MKKGILSLSVAAILFGLNSNAGAQEFVFGQEVAPSQKEIKKLATIINAEPLERIAPKYPTRAARKNMEGWVRLSYVVDVEGKVKDIIVHDSSGNKSFEKASIRAIEQWVYSPATKDGKPIEQCNSKVQMDFKMQNSDKGVTRRFRKNYISLQEAIQAGDMDKADELYAEMVEDGQYNFAESVHLSVATSMYHEAKGNTSGMIKELKAINRIGSNYLKADAYAALSQKLYSQLIQQNKISEANYVVENLNKFASKHEMTAKLSDIHENVKAQVAELDNLLVTGQIKGDKSWSHQLYFSKFDIQSNGAPLDRIELRCQNKRSTYGNVKEEGFSIPASWGQCHIYVDGAPDTEFSVVEYRS